jgi:pimeloyl-ACP methyl ester carboxylesterase
MKRYLRRRNLLLGPVFIGASTIGFGATAIAAENIDPAAACQKLASMASFPVSPTQITLAKFNPAGETSTNGTSLPAHCQVQGIINKRTGADGLPYGDRFELRLPIPTEWNGRFMFQRGGGTEGAVPPAVGVAGTLTPTLAHGWAVASQDGGHENADLPTRNTFLLEPQAVVDHAYGSIDATTRTAKFLIDAFYGQQPNKSYFVGCSTGGRQGMVLSQNFPDYYDGIVAGDPVYDLESIALSEVYGVEAIAAITPAPIEKLADGSPILYPAFPEADQKLFTRALLAACDKLDGTADGVVDDVPACRATFDPATFVFPDTRQLLNARAPRMRPASARRRSAPSRKSTRVRAIRSAKRSAHQQMLRSGIMSMQQRSAIRTTAVSWRQRASHRARSARRPRRPAISHWVSGKSPITG